MMGPRGKGASLQVDEFAHGVPSQEESHTKQSSAVNDIGGQFWLSV